MTVSILCLVLTVPWFGLQDLIAIYIHTYFMTWLVTPDRGSLTLDGESAHSNNAIMYIKKSHVLAELYSTSRELCYFMNKRVCSWSTLFVEDASKAQSERLLS